MSVFHNPTSLIQQFLQEGKLPNPFTTAQLQMAMLENHSFMIGIPNIKNVKCKTVEILVRDEVGKNPNLQCLKRHLWQYGSLK